MLPSLTSSEQQLSYPRRLSGVHDITKKIKVDWKWMQSLPNFSFTADGLVIIPRPPKPRTPPHPEEEGEFAGSDPSHDGSVSRRNAAHAGTSKGKSQKQTARRPKIRTELPEEDVHSSKRRRITNSTSYSATSATESTRN